MEINFGISAKLFKLRSLQLKINFRFSQLLIEIKSEFLKTFCFPQAKKHGLKGTVINFQMANLSQGMIRTYLEMYLN